MYGIPAPGGNHTPEFTAAAVTPRAHDESIKAMTAMACVGMRYLADGEFANSVSVYDSAGLTSRSRLGSRTSRSSLRTSRPLLARCNRVNTK